jgi:uncharacterized protein (DUF58 family)
VSQSSTHTARSGLSFDAAFLKRLEYLNVVARKILSGTLRADRKSARKGVSAEFADHRGYVAGDDFRNVDWHLYARLEELFVKLYKEEENLHLTVLLDTSLSMERGAPNKLNYAIEVAAALAYIGMSNMDCVNMLRVGPKLGGGRWHLKGRGKIYELFDFLSAVEAEGTTDLERSVKEFTARERRRGVVVVVSDFYDLDGYESALKRLRASKHDVTVIHVVDPGEADPTQDPSLRGDLRLVDSETGAVREVNVTDALRRRYRDAFEALRGGVERFCLRQEVGYVHAKTEISFDDLVLGVLRRGGLVG